MRGLQLPAVDGEPHRVKPRSSCSAGGTISQSSTAYPAAIAAVPGLVVHRQGIQQLSHAGCEAAEARHLQTAT